MRKILFLFVALCGLLFAQSGKVGGMDIEYSTKKPLSSGANEFIITLQKNGDMVRGAKIELVAIMPPMPSMPKMDFKAQAKEEAQGYSATVHFPHGGTWQLKFKIQVNGKKYTYKSSVDF
ncbi:copper resistance protein [Helicobacter cholecystus]|uniref:Copper resistance protein n=1 Tax=Helicobacter cholecystus TaxID=45498 RepID=A0A3D8IY41_9HELI|nr:FixH family protein [Helicobacter cholecystus]RDU69471.1 copper resistance protein [Helicobacter cholecystus]VEJ24022.1 copper resistance determinant protein CrdA [Helicobacter cholecystus]